MRSTVARKALMAVTGLILIVFLLVHMYGNLKMFVGYEAFDHYAHWLKGATEDGGIMAPIMPAGQFIWVFRAALLLAIALHVWSAATLSVKTVKNRGDKYQVTKRQAQTYSSRTMRWGGVIILFFVIFHLVQFTIVPGILGGKAADPHTMVLAGFQQWWITALYAVSILFVCMHIRHGFWSAFATLGGNLSVNSRKWLNIIALVVSVALYVGFMIMPLWVQFGILK
ncbi:MAG: succinate dehydrogenase cytochrome b subunit [Propionibacterium sp.]|nr:succinate dehydrogenase cytochrome b subunit [Propionibacterium sp.]